MRVFLTGVTGFLGSHVAEVLLGDGHDVVALARNPAAIDSDLAPWLEGRPSEPDVHGHSRAASAMVTRSSSTTTSAPAYEGRRGALEVLKGSLSDERVLREGIADCAAVVHVAGLIQARTEREYMRVNRDGTEALLRAAEPRFGDLKRFVLVSSQAAGGPSRDGRPVSGEEPARPVSAYGRSKLAGEERVLARADRLQTTILRPPVIFGSRDRMLARMFRSVSRGRAEVWSSGTNAFNVVHAPDVARAASLALAVDHPTGSVLYTGDDRVFTWRTFLGALAEVAGRRVRILPIPPAVFRAVAAGSTAVSFLTGRPPLLSMDKLAELRQPAWICTSRRTRERLSWSTRTSVEEALVATLAWYKARGLV